MSFRIRFKDGEERSFNSLVGADLREANLSGANLKGANLRNCRHSLEVLSSVSGLEWDVVCKNDLVGVGCQEHLLSKWLEFSEEEIREMDSKALDFYPFLISMLQNIYKDSVYSEVLGRRL